MAVDYRQQAAPRARAAPLAGGARAPRSVFTMIHGLRLHHLEWGPADGSPLVLVHGLRAHAWVWTRLAPYFTPHYRLLAPDLRGHGEPLAAALVRADLAALRCPTLIVHGGRRAYLRPAAAAEMQTLARDSRVVAVPAAGHCIMEERPGTFASIVQRFFAETAAARV